ncbi:MAG: hypothetical protein ACJA1L_003585 [Paracoccaceae bacterium]|jgi:hypothetical protein
MANFSVTDVVTSPMPMLRPASSQNASSQIASSCAKTARFSSSSAVASCPVRPKSAARAMTPDAMTPNAMTPDAATPMQVTSMRSITSCRLPVGGSAPQDDPTASMKFSAAAAAVPGTPSMAASPLQRTPPPRVSMLASTRAPVLTAWMRTAARSPVAATSPISSAAGPTPDRVLP